MSVRIGAGLSTQDDPRVGAIEAATAAGDVLGRGAADVALVFAMGGYLAEPEATLEGVHEALQPDVLVGCGAAGVLAGGRELESGSAIAVWAASLGDGAASAFHIAVEQTDEGLTIDGMPSLDGAAGALLLPDPSSFPTEGVLAHLHQHHPGVPVLGGLASARTLDGAAALFIDDEVRGAGGAVGLRLDGVELLPCVSQGAAPIGPELTITAADGNVIHELAGKPSLVKLREVVGGLDEYERTMLAQGLLLGVVVGGPKPEYERGDFLVRGVLGADAQEGTIAVGAQVRPGQLVRLHARDAASADADLRAALALRRTALGGERPAGALIFTCNGRGRGMFGGADHDASALQRELAAPPAAGLFAAGEIGPVGGESFLHGFTATVAVFPA